jgi:hypothetical protein
MRASESIPFDPPAAGTWLRCRLLPRAAIGRARPRLAPEWYGCWHVFSGDLRARDARSHEIQGRALCGVGLTLRDFNPFEGSQMLDFVVADEQPTVDACKTCARMAARRGRSQGLGRPGRP